MVQPVVTFHRSISLGSYRRIKSESFGRKWVFGEKNDPLQEDFENFVLKGFTISQIHVLCTNFVKFGRPEVGEIARCLPDKKQKLGKRSRSRFCADRAQNLSGPAPDNILGVSQMSTFLATPAAGETQAHQTWHGDRRPRARSFTSKTFPGTTHSFAARGAQNVGEPDPLNLKPPNSVTP